MRTRSGSEGMSPTSSSGNPIFIARHPFFSLLSAILLWNGASPAKKAITDLMGDEGISQFTNDQRQSISDLMRQGQEFFANLDNEELNNKTFQKILDEVSLNTTQSHEINSPERSLLDRNIFASLFGEKGLLDRFIAEQQETEIKTLQSSGISKDEAIDQLAKNFRENWVHGEHDFIRDYLVAPAAILIACVVASAFFAKAKEKCSSSYREIEQNDLDQLPLTLQEEITKIAIHSQFEIPHKKSELFQQIYDAISNYESGDISKIISNADSKVAIEMFKILSLYLTATTLPLVGLEQFAGLSLRESGQVHKDAIKAGAIKGLIAALCCKFIAFKEAEQKMSNLFEKDDTTNQLTLNQELFEEFKTKHPEVAQKLLDKFQELSQPDSFNPQPTGGARPLLEVECRAP